MTVLYAQPLQKITVQLQWKHQFEFAGFYAAKQQGYYKDAGLDVAFKEFQSGMDITEEVLSGRADYATSYSSIVLDYLRKKPIVLLANFFKQSPIVLATQKDIKTPKELQGKRVMGLLDSTHNQTLLMMLERFDVRKDDFINIDRSFAIDSFVNKDVDAISIFTTNEIFALNELGVAYNILDPAVYGIKFYDINLFTSHKELQKNPQRTKAFRQATIKGWEYALAHKEEIVDLILQKYDTQKKTKEALLFEARQIEYLMLTNVYPVGSVDMRIIEAIADSYIQTHHKEALSKEALNAFVYSPKKQKLFFSGDQKQYLQRKKVIKMCVDPNWMPLEMIDQGKHVGIAADVMQQISKRIQTPVELLPTRNWSQSLQEIRSGRCDILALAEKTPQRQEYLDFTIPYVKTPLVIATQAGIPFIHDLSSIKDKKLGIVANYSMAELLRQEYKGINIIAVDSVEDGLKRVGRGELFGFLDNALVINHAIQKNGYKDISVNGQFQQMTRLGIATRKDEPLLYQIMQKALLSMEKKSIENIIDQWSNIKYQKRYDYELVTKILVAAFFLLGVFGYWTLRLREEIRKKDETKAKLKASEERFRTLFNLAPVMIDSFDGEGKVVLWNRECEKVFGWSREELRKYDDPIKLFYPGEKDRQELAKSMKEAFVFKEWKPKTKDGRTLVTMWANIHMPKGEIIHVGYDITAQREYEQQLSEKTQELESAKRKLQNLNNTLEERVKVQIEKNLKQQLLLLQQNRLAQMGEMIENIAHQWRQPLAQINSCVLILDAYCDRENALKESSVREKFNEIESLTAYMSKTIDDFKNFFNPDKKKERFSLHQTVYNAFKIVEGALKVNHIQVKIDIDEEVKINSYIQELEHVFIIIFNNAKDALVAKGVKEPEVSVFSDREENFIKLLFCDNGGGIKPGMEEKIFEPYFTTKHKSQGTGLGLYMAKMIIEEGLGGKLLAYNTDSGACFELHLPKEKENG